MTGGRRAALGLVALAAACENAAARVDPQSFFAGEPLITPPAVRALGALPTPPRAPAAAPVFSAPAGVMEEPVAVATDPAAGTVWVLDRMRRQVLAFDSVGRVAARFGRRGRGPGEYEAPTTILRLPWNGRLAVWDGALRRLTELTPTGEVVRTIPLAQPGPNLRRIRAAPGGYVYEVHSDPLRVPPEAQRGYLVAVDSLGAGADTLVSFRVPGVQAQERVENGARHSTWSEPPAFTPELRWDLFPDGAAVLAPGGAYEWWLLPRGGEGALRVTRPWTPTPVTRADRIRRLSLERDERRVGRSDVSLALVERATRGRFERVRPSVTGVVADGARVWVRRFDTGTDGRGGSAVWDIYTRQGQSLGVAAFPPGFHPVRFDPGRIYGIARDSLGVKSVAAYPRRAFGAAAGAP